MPITREIPARQMPTKAPELMAIPAEIAGWIRVIKAHRNSRGDALTIPDVFGLAAIRDAIRREYKRTVAAEADKGGEA